MDIKRSNSESILPALNNIFDEQQKDYFSENKPKSQEETLAFGGWSNRELAGGIIGKRQYDTLHISLLGVKKKYQKLGLGSKLIAAIETQAVEDGVRTITLTTKAYQALDFYLKQGYKIFGELKDVPMIGTTKYYLVKRISR